MSLSTTSGVRFFTSLKVLHFFPKQFLGCALNGNRAYIRGGIRFFGGILRGQYINPILRFDQQNNTSRDPFYNEVFLNRSYIATSLIFYGNGGGANEDHCNLWRITLDHQ
jgi:hypothetical protein